VGFPVYSKLSIDVGSLSSFASSLSSPSLEHIPPPVAGYYAACSRAVTVVPLLSNFFSPLLSIALFLSLFPLKLTSALQARRVFFSTETFLKLHLADVSFVSPPQARRGSVHHDSIPDRSSFIGLQDLNADFEVGLPPSQADDVTPPPSAFRTLLRHVKL